MRTFNEMKSLSETKIFSTVASVVLAIIALMQLLRFVLDWSVVVNGTNVPVWVSAIAFVVTAGLSVMVWQEAH